MKRIVWIVCVVVVLALFVGGVAEADSPKVYLGGMPISINMVEEGLVVMSIDEVVGKEGVTSPALKAGLQPGDVLVRMNGKPIPTRRAVQKVLDEAQGCDIDIEISRNGQTLTLSIQPEYDMQLKGYRLGLYLKEGVSGIGTVSFIDPRSGAFGALGHAIVDPDSQTVAEPYGGHIYPTQITHVQKGTAGHTGQLNGPIGEGSSVGNVCKNTHCGIFGVADESLWRDRPLVSLASKSEVHPGEAVIISTVCGDKPKGYAVQILEVKRHAKGKEKGILLQVVDSRLLEKTGGIVQGMSGSPILQNGRLVGAVTHVVVADPTKGYGILIEHMLSEAE